MKNVKRHMTETDGTNSIKSPLRILHLEDSPADAELIKKTLVSEGINCDIELVETQADFMNVIEKDGFDIILLDYTLPSFNGHEALAIIKEKYLDVPVIFVSGTMGEEFAIETLKSGATDYVLKDSLSRLVPSIIRALHEVEERAERKRAEEALQTEKVYLDQLFDNAPEAIVMGDNDANVLRINSEFTRLFGYTSDEAHGRSIDDLLAPENLREEALSITRRVAHGEKVNFETMRSRKDGTIIHVSVLASPIVIGNKQIGVYGIYRDVTERIMATERMNKLINIVTKAKQEWEIAFDNVIELIMIIDKDLRIIRCNKSFSEFVRIPIKEVIGKKCYEFFGCNNKQIGLCRVSMQTGELLQKSEIITKTGRWFYKSHRAIFDNEGIFRFSVVIATDITDLKNTQQQLLDYQKELEKRIKELEDFYDMAIGRELRMVELKKEIEGLKAELSKYKKDT